MTYASTDKVFATPGGTDFNFDGFGTNSWGAFSAGAGSGQQDNRPALAQQFSAANSNSSPFGQVDNHLEGFNSDFNFNKGSADSFAFQPQGNSLGGIGNFGGVGSSNSGPIFEGQKKEKKGGFLGFFNVNKVNQMAANDDFDRQYDEYIKKKTNEPEFKQPGNPQQNGFGGGSFPVGPSNTKAQEEEEDLGDVVNKVASGLKK